MLVEKNIIYNSGEEPAEGDWHHQTEYAEYRGNLYYNFKDIPPEDEEAVVKTVGDRVLEAPLEGPRETEGKIHSRERFLGFKPVGNCMEGRDSMGASLSSFREKQ